MNDLWKILNKLEEMSVDFNIQCLNFPASRKYNLRVNDIHGETHYLHADSRVEIEGKLKVFWGHLVTSVEMGLPPL